MNKFELEIDKDKKYNAIILENRLQAILSLYQEEHSDNPTKVLLYNDDTNKKTYWGVVLEEGIKI